jgi:RNase P/RNase MRP subunit POP5
MNAPSCNKIWLAVSRSFNNLFGITAAAGAGLFFLENRSGKDYLVIRVNNRYANQLRASVAAIAQINGFEVCLWVSRLAGTVKSLMKKSTDESITKPG